MFREKKKSIGKKKMTLFRTPPPRELELVLLPGAVQSVGAVGLCPARSESHIPGLEKMGSPGRQSEPPRDARGETRAAPRPKVDSKGRR